MNRRVKQLDQLLGNSNKFPVKPAQIYGLRQIARQQPGKVESFANHQRERTKRKLENASERTRPGLQAEIDFWTLVSDLCGDSALAWSVHKEGHAHLPAELQNIPARRQGMTHEEQRRAMNSINVKGNGLGNGQTSIFQRFLSVSVRTLCTA